MRSRFTACVLIAVLATGCASRGAAVALSLGATYVVAGDALLLRDHESEHGWALLAVGAYAILAGVIVEQHARAQADERTTAMAGGGASSPGTARGTTWTPASGASESDPRSAVPAADEASETRPPRQPAAGYDRTGAYAGRVDASGAYYDRTGAPDGRLDTSGSYYDRTGAPSGRIDTSGGYYDRTGAPAGRIDTSGAIYDGTGAPRGRITDDGTIYDASGGYAGRVDGSCDDACKRAAAGRILLDR